MIGRLGIGGVSGLMRVRIAAAAAAVAVTVGFTIAAAADEAGPHVVKNPYADVNWDQVRAYRANFHSHTVRSDGRAEPGELIRMYADAGYHILAITDHDNYYTRREGERDVIEKYVHRDEHSRVPTSETTWPWTRWIDEEPSHIWVYGGIESSALFPDLGEEGMLAVRGAELTSHPHMASLFNRCGWPHRDQTNDDRLECVERHDGLVFWAHPTHYVPGGPWEDRYFENPTWEEAVEHFGDYIARYESLLGLEMSTRGDRLERDRELFDRLLQKYYPEHEVFIKGSDDTHATSVAGNAPLTLILADSLTEEAVRHALTRGHTFVGSRSDAYPRFNRIEVDERAKQIVVDIEAYEQITWIKDGEEHAQGAAVDYSEMEAAVLRFEVELEGAAIFYSQGFYVE